MKTLASLVAAMWRDERGMSSVEYALLLGFSAGAVILSTQELSTAVSGEIREAANCFTAPDSC